MRVSFSRPRGRPIVALAILASLAALPGVSPAAAADTDGTVRYGVLTEPGTASPYACCASWAMMALAYDQLTGLDETTGEIVPSYAESWSPSADGLTWTFKIRPGMTWSDGEPATARDAAFTFNFLLGAVGDPNESTWGWVGTGWGIKDWISEARAVDDLTLELVTKGQTNWPLYSHLPILPEHIWKDVSYEQANTTFYSDAPQVSGGAFVLTEWQHTKFLRYTRNEHWWGWGANPGVDEVLMIPYASQDSMASALKAGELDIIDNVAGGQATDLADNDAIEVVSQPWKSVLEMLPNTRDAHLGDIELRHALDFAIDREVLVERVFDGNAVAGQGIVSPSTASSYTGSVTPNPYDPAEAIRRLDAAGYVDVNGDGVREDKDGQPFDIELLVNTSKATHTRAAEFVAEWLKAVGLGVTVVGLEGGAYWDKWGAHDFGLGLSDWVPPGFIVDYTSDPEGLGSGLGCDVCVDKLKTFWTTFDPAERKAVAGEIDQAYWERFASLALVYPNAVEAHRTDRFTGWTDAAGPMLPPNAFPWTVFTRLQPVTAEASPSAEAPSAAATGAPSAAATTAPSPAPDAADASGGSNVLPIAIAVLVVVAVAGGLLLRRRGSRAA